MFKAALLRQSKANRAQRSVHGGTNKQGVVDECKGMVLSPETEGSSQHGQVPGQEGDCWLPGAGSESHRPEVLLWGDGSDLELGRVEMPTPSTY